MARTRKRALWIAAESTYGTDPSSSGSGYTAVPALSIGDLADGKEQLPTNYTTGRNFPTAPLAGPDGWSFDFEVPIIGLATAAGDGDTPGSDDWFDQILTHIFGTQAVMDGEGVAGSSTTTSLILDTDLAGLGAQQLVPVYESGLPTAGPRTQWALVSVDNSSATYTIAPTLDAAPTTAAVMYGTKTYTYDDDGGASRAFVYQSDDLEYTLCGGRITAWTVTGEVGQIMRMKCTVSGDNKTLTTKSGSSLPAAAAAPAITPIITLLSPVWFNSTKYSTRKIEISGGLNAAVQESTSATNGRADYENIGHEPMITIEPLRTDAILELKRSATKGRLLVQLGGGVLAGGVLNTCAIHAEEAVATSVAVADDKGRLRQTVQFKVTDPVYFSGTTAARFFQFARA